VSPNEPGAVKENQRAAKRPPQEIPESDEHLSIECPVPCKRNHDGRPVGAPSSAACALHVIGAPGWNVSENDAVQSADINAKFHRGGGRQ
jgi:hypothetical protein